MTQSMSGSYLDLIPAYCKHFSLWTNAQSGRCQASPEVGPAKVCVAPCESGAMWHGRFTQRCFFPSCLGLLKFDHSTEQLKRVVQQGAFYGLSWVFYMFSTCFPGFQDESFWGSGGSYARIPSDDPKPGGNTGAAVAAASAESRPRPAESIGLLDSQRQESVRELGKVFYGVALTQEKYLAKTDF